MFLEVNINNQLLNHFHMHSEKPNSVMSCVSMPSVVVPYFGVKLRVWDLKQPLTLANFYT